MLELILQTNTVENTVNPRGLIHFQHNQFEDALEIFQKNLNVDKEHKDSIYHKGLCLFNLKRYLDALVTLLELNNDYKQVPHYIKESKKKLTGEYDEPFDEISRLEIEGKFLEAKPLLISCY
jgi:tetratricopeptide (TPR) repeat protein